MWDKWPCSSLHISLICIGWLLSKRNSMFISIIILLDCKVHGRSTSMNFQAISCGQPCWSEVTGQNLSPVAHIRLEMGIYNTRNWPCRTNPVICWYSFFQVGAVLFSFIVSVSDASKAIVLSAEGNKSAVRQMKKRWEGSNSNIHFNGSIPILAK